MAVNVRASFMLTGLLLPSLVKSESAQILNTSSLAHGAARADLKLSRMPVFQGFHRYAQSKLLLWGLTRAFAEKLLPYGVRSNALHPGIVRTELSNGPGAISGLMRFAGPLLMSPQRAGELIADIMTKPQFAQCNGEYFVKGKLSRVKKSGRGPELPSRAWKMAVELAAYEPSLD